MGDLEKRRAQRRDAARTFRKNHPEKIKRNNQEYYTTHRQEISEERRQESARKRIERIEANDTWIHISKFEDEPDLPLSFNHVVSDCQCKGRRCKQCEKVKCTGKFYQDNRYPDTFTTLCKLCYGQRVKKYKQLHPDEVDASAARYNASAERKERLRAYRLKRNYNLTPEQHEEMYKLQNGCCALCRCASEKTLHIDHNHTTGQVRALLCNRCNSLIGYSGESIERLRQAIEYLETHQKEEEDDGK